jgi:glycosyltransferase involved in cell wall biosynthesis
VDPGDLSGLIQAMLRLARSRSLRQDMGKRGFQLVAEEFSAETMTNRYLELYSPSTAEQSRT